jgi:G3E family GTPase
MVESPAFTPVNLITGFLGSGKTTLLNRMLASPRLADTAVLINEFGEVGLDHELIERVDENTILLQSGCLCCTIRGELADAIKTLHSRRERGEIPVYRRLLIESTGLADPLPILTTIAAEPTLRHHYRLGLVVTTIDAVNGMSQLDRQPESLKQAAVADRLIVTKTDIAAPAEVDILRARLRRLNLSAPLRNALDADLDPAALIGNDLFDLDAKSREVAHWFDEAFAEAAGHDHVHHRHDPNRHGDDIRAFAFSFVEPINWTAFGLWLSMLLNRHGENILRVKGLLSIEGEAAPVAVHAVQQLVHAPMHLPRWPSGDRRTRLVFIVRGLQEAAVRRSFAAFVLDRSAKSRRQ